MEPVTRRIENSTRAQR
ncbi:unnamed protein product [Victoria cruziana]